MSGLESGGTNTVSMTEPSVDALLPMVDCKFSLITMVLKRARQINNGAPKLIETDSIKPVTIALEEIAAGKIQLSRPKDGAPE